MRSHGLFWAFIAIVITGLSSAVLAGDWQKPWTTEKAGAAERCRKSFDDFQLQALCMDNERDGYDKMQGNFGMPPDVAYKAKVRCAKSFDDFQLQALCMQNEKEGYDKMKDY
jgi:hypothetical protein